jgi:uncharacterized membrane protein (DUF106 family)
MVRRILIFAVTVVVLVAGLAGVVRAQSAQDDQAALKQALYNLDMSIDSLRKGDNDGSKNYLSNARTIYLDDLNLGGRIENVDNALDNRIKTNFDSLYQTPVEENIRVLRADVSLAASKWGISLSFVFNHSILFIIFISIVFALVVTLISKRVVNWEEVKQKKKRVSDWQKALMDAQRKKDMKTVHKLQQEQKEMMALQGQIMMASFKPAIFYMVPYFILWMALSGLYGGWVVAWLPFNLPLPVIGTTVSLGFLGWYFLVYFGFSSIWRRLLIGD